MGLSELEKILVTSQAKLDQIFEELDDLDLEEWGNEDYAQWLRKPTRTNRFVLMLEEFLRDGDTDNFVHYAMKLAAAVDMLRTRRVLERVLDSMEQ